MDTRNYLILIKGVDKTKEVSSWKTDFQGNFTQVAFNRGKPYKYRSANVRIFSSPAVIDAGCNLVIKDGIPCADIIKILRFDSYYRLFYRNGHEETVDGRRIRMVGSALENTRSKSCFDYLKEIADCVGLRDEDGRNILAARYEKIDFVREDSVLACYLDGRVGNNRTGIRTPAIFPFGFNISQKRAVENALSSRISMIEGPPGTGKTQTILNIIANAVMRGESAAVVSSNNSATANVYEKMEKYGVSFLAAQLGNAENKQLFIDSQEALPDLSEWLLPAGELAENERRLREIGTELDRMLSLQNERASLLAESDALKKEYEHFRDIFRRDDTTDGKKPLFSEKTRAGGILRFAAEYELKTEEGAKPGFFDRLKWFFRYGLRNFRYARIPDLAEYCHSLFYDRRAAEIRKGISQIESELRDFDFGARMKKYAELSQNVFKAKLARRYTGPSERKIYELDELWKRSEDFIWDYPVVLSTSYSLRSSLSGRFVYDYVIVDEASQVDIATGALAVSCGKKAVIVGDLRQLPNVVTPEARRQTESIFSRYGLAEAYSYADNSLLSSAEKLFPQAPKVLLREHYRCHPEIIGFCSQRFYNNDLIIMTEPKSDRQAMLVYRTPPGNHARGHYNQRQIDVILQEVIPEQGLNTEDGSLGIVTPYRNQADMLQKCFAGTCVKADTADKFQGQERKVMIFSTVDNEIGDFASDPNRLNVAVSRAVDQFIVVTGSCADGSSPIHDLIGYIQYHNHDIIDSKISSVFDCLYKNASSAREEIMRKHGRISEVASENLMYGVIRDVLSMEKYSKYDVVAHVPLRSMLLDLSRLSGRELSFASNHLTHVDFLIFSRLSHMPALAIEVDGFAYHNANDKQRERDAVKDSVLRKYGIPLFRFSTVGSGEKERLIQALESV